MIETIQAVVLGAVQGLTEFLPVSSSGHLILFPHLFGWKDQGLAFDALVHLGTFTALMWYYKKDLRRLFEGLVQKKKESVDFFLRLIVATIPAVILALLLNGLIETYLRSDLVVVLGLVIWGIALYLADHTSSRRKEHLDEYQHVTWKQALCIGLAQPIALLPGTSRSGITITAGLFSGLSRRAAAQFSFFLAMPVTGLAGIFGAYKSLSEPASYSIFSHVIGFLSALLFGLFAIHFLLSFLKKRKYDLFVYYRIALAVVIGIFLIGS